MADASHDGHPTDTSSEAPPLRRTHPGISSSSSYWAKDPSEHLPLGLAGKLFEAIVKLSIQIPRRVNKPKHAEKLRDEIERLFLWGTCFSTSQGNLDELLSQSADLRQAVLRVLYKLARIIQDDLLEVIGRHSMPQQEVTQLATVLDSAKSEKATEGISFVSRRTKTAKQLTGFRAINQLPAQDDVPSILEDVTIYIDCLMDLSLSIESPPMNPEPSKETDADSEFFNVGSPEALAACYLLRNQFPGMEKYVVERLGEADARYATRGKVGRSGSSGQVGRSSKPAHAADLGRSEHEPASPEVPQSANPTSPMQLDEPVETPNAPLWQGDQPLPEGQTRMSNTPPTSSSSRSDSTSTVTSLSPPYTTSQEVVPEYQPRRATHVRSVSTSALPRTLPDSVNYGNPSNEEPVLRTPLPRTPLPRTPLPQGPRHMSVSPRAASTQSPPTDSADSLSEAQQAMSELTSDGSQTALSNLENSPSKHAQNDEGFEPRKRPRVENSRRRHHGWSLNRPIRDDDFEANCEWCPFYLHQPWFYRDRPWTSCRRQRAEISHIIAHLISDHGLIRGSHPERRSQRYITKCASWDQGIKGRGNCSKCAHVSLWDEDDKKDEDHAGQAMCLRCYTTLPTKSELYDHLAEPDLCIYNEDFPMKKKARIMYTTFASSDEFPDFLPSPVIFPPREGAKKRNMKVEARPIITVERLHDIQLHIPEAFSTTESRGSSSAEGPPTRYGRLHAATVPATTDTRSRHNRPTIPLAFSLPPIQAPSSRPLGPPSLPTIASLPGIGNLLSGRRHGVRGRWIEPKPRVRQGEEE